MMHGMARNSFAKARVLRAFAARLQDDDMPFGHAVTFFDEYLEDAPHPHGKDEEEWNQVRGDELDRQIENIRAGNIYAFAVSKVSHPEHAVSPPDLSDLEFIHLIDVAPQFRKLSAMARAVFWHLRACFGPNADEPLTSHQRLATMVGCHVDTVHEVLNRELIPQGWLTQRIHPTRFGRSIIYTLGPTSLDAIAAVQSLSKQKGHR